jgi:hypothetical protein
MGTACSTNREERNAYRLQAGNTEGKKLLERLQSLMLFTYGAHIAKSS